MLAARKWTDDFCRWLSSQPETGVCYATFPAYRPDLVADLAKAAGAGLLDFRKEYMSPMGWRAVELKLQDLEAAARVHSSGGRTIFLNNAEALLSLFGKSERQHWFCHMQSQAFAGRLVIPLFLYASELDAASARTRFDFSAIELPEESFLTQLTRFA